METTRDCNFKYREKAKKELFSICPQWSELTLEMDQFISFLLFQLKTISVSEEKQKYRVALIVSFIRSHFVIIDLIESSDLIEAATIIRKQFELLARFSELEISDLHKLLGKVPNIKNVNIGATYSALSEIAHSSKFEPLSLLGMETSEECLRFSVYPQFSEHTLTTCNLFMDAFFKFAACMLEFDVLKQNKKYEDIAMDILNRIIAIGKTSNIKYFEHYEE